MAPQTTLTLCYTHDQLESFVTAIYEVLSQKPLVLFLSGPLGAGKTTFSQAWLRCCGVQGVINSPTYTIVESYQARHGTWHHFDCYRLDTVEMLYDVGIEEYLDDNILCEWPDKAMASLITPTIAIELRFTDTQNTRIMQITTSHQLHAKLTSILKGYIVE